MEVLYDEGLFTMYVFIAFLLLSYEVSRFLESDSFTAKCVLRSVMLMLLSLVWPLRFLLYALRKLRPKVMACLCMITGH